MCRLAAWGAAFALGALVGVARSEDRVTCASCHTAEAKDFETSIHRSSLRCQDCHGGADGYDVNAAELARFREALASPDLTMHFDHGSAFRGKPSRREIPERCGTCHADVERMNPYGLRTDQLMRYWTSVHGKTLKEKGDDRVAVCIDCHGTHAIQSGDEPSSRTYPLNVPDTCGACHSNAALMSEFGLPAEIVEEYRQSVHGRLLLEQKDTGAPTCATCHGNHSAMPPGFASVGAVCGQCHQHAAANFATSVHANLEEFHGCVQCHGGGEGRHFHDIQRITNPAGLMIRRYAHLLRSNRTPSHEEVTEAIHPFPKQIIERVLPTCTECHEDIEEDESLPKLLGLLDTIAEAERTFVKTGARLDRVGKGVLLVDRQRFLFEDAKTILIGLAPLQHTLSNEKVEAKVKELNDVCTRVNGELDALEESLAWRYKALVPVWAFALMFALVLYIKYRRLKAEWVKDGKGASTE